LPHIVGCSSWWRSAAIAGEPDETRRELGIVPNSRHHPPVPRPRPTRSAAARPTRTAARPRPAAPAEAHPWRRDRELAQLTARILSLQTQSCRRSSDEIVAIGELLELAHSRLPRGQWLDWLAHSVPFDRSTADNYRKLAAFARSDAAEYRRLRHLGPTKLYVMIALPRERRRSLPLARLLPVAPDRRKTVETMTAAELTHHLGGLAVAPARAVPVETVVQRARFRVAGIDAVADVLVARRDEIDGEVARAIGERLRAIATKLFDAFAS
jgi:hypothetical protein